MTAPKAQTKIFISYRRSGESGFVGWLYERLVSVYGKENVFRDISGLRTGEEFEKRIVSKLSEATVVIAVIGADWVGRRRLRKPRICADDDWVRREIEHALASQTPVIPVLVGEASLPASGLLPASLRGLLSVHVGRLRDESSENDFSQLIKAIDEVAEGEGGEGDERRHTWRRVEAGKPSLLRIALMAAALVAIVVLGPFMIYVVSVMRGQGQGSVRLDDPATWVAPQVTETRGPVAHQALEQALFELKASTEEAGDNAGYNVEKFSERFNTPGQNIPWSSVFVTWCYLEALKRTKNVRDAKLPFADSPANMVVAASLRKSGWLVEPFDASRAKPGDIVFFSRANMPIGHAEIVYAVHSGNICSIGGNVNNRVSGRCRPAGGGNIAALGVIPQEAFDQPPPDLPYVP